MQLLGWDLPKSKIPFLTQDGSAKIHEVAKYFGISVDDVKVAAFPLGNKAVYTASFRADSARFRTSGTDRLTDRPTDGRTDIVTYRVACTRLKRKEQGRDER